jgi:hypothetical protein
MANGQAERKIPRFGRSVVVAATNVLSDLLSHAKFSRLLLEWELDGNPRATSTGSKLDRANVLAKFAVDNPGTQTAEGPLADAIVEKAGSLWLERVAHADEFGSTAPTWESVEEFQRALGRDGFMLSSGGVRKRLPDVVDLPEAQDEVDALLEKHQLTEAKGHLDRARSAHGRGEWAAANAQLRTFVESLLDGIAERVDPAAAARPTSSNARRAMLANSTPPFLLRDLNEWDDSGHGFVNGFIKRLHPQGSHPGLSDDEDCTFRLHIVLLTARLFLRRLTARP